jgi:hypothetical protein
MFPAKGQGSLGQPDSKYKIIKLESSGHFFDKGSFFFRNGVFSASASIDAHGRYIKKRINGSSLQVAQETKTSHRLRMTLR